MTAYCKGGFLLIACCLFSLQGIAQKPDSTGLPGQFLTKKVCLSPEFLAGGNWPVMAAGGKRFQTIRFHPVFRYQINLNFSYFFTKNHSLHAGIGVSMMSVSFTSYTNAADLDTTSTDTTTFIGFIKENTDLTPRLHFTLSYQYQVWLGKYVALDFTAGAGISFFSPGELEFSSLNAQGEILQEMGLYARSGSNVIPSGFAEIGVKIFWKRKNHLFWRFAVCGSGAFIPDLTGNYTSYSQYAPEEGDIYFYDHYLSAKIAFGFIFRKKSDTRDYGFR